MECVLFGISRTQSNESGFVGIDIWLQRISKNDPLGMLTAGILFSKNSSSKSSGEIEDVGHCRTIQNAIRSCCFAAARRYAALCIGGSGIQGREWMVSGAQDTNWMPGPKPGNERDQGVDRFPNAEETP